MRSTACNRHLLAPTCVNVPHLVHVIAFVIVVVVIALSILLLLLLLVLRGGRAA